MNIALSMGRREAAILTDVTLSEFGILMDGDEEEIEAMLDAASTDGRLKVDEKGSQA